MYLIDYCDNKYIHKYFSHFEGFYKRIAIKKTIFLSIFKNTF